MAGQIEVNEKVTKIKAKQSELSANAAAGKGELASATSKVTELKTEMTGLIPDIPETPSIQGELSKLGSLTEGGLVSKIGALVTQYGSAIPGLSSLLGTMGLSSFPPTISVSSIMDQIPNVEVIDGATVVQPAESKVAEEAPAAPTDKELIDIAYKDVSYSILLECYSLQLDVMFDTRPLAIPSSQWTAMKYVYYYNWWADLGEQVGATPEEMSKYFNVRDKEKADRHTALYTGADYTMVFKGVKALYISSKGEHPESADLLDFADVCNYWWEKQQKNT
jgi:hypothetical protein